MLHLFAGAAIAALAGLLALLLGMPSWGIWGALAALTAGLCKEALDSLGYGTVEASDVFWTVAGAAPTVALWWIFT